MGYTSGYRVSGAGVGGQGGCVRWGRLGGVETKKVERDQALGYE